MLPCDFYPASEDYADHIVRYSNRSTDSLYELAGTRCVNLIDREFAVIHSPLNRESPVWMSRDTYASIPKMYGLLDVTALESSGILTAFGQPSLRATGRGVLIGFIDTGIDYTNPLFRLPDGRTRILNIWDQTIRGSQEPEAVAGFQPFYGSTYDRNQIDEALASEDPLALVPSRDTDGHGTFLAGVAAGSRVSDPVPFSGAAPDAAIAVVKLKPAKQYLRDFFLIPPGAVAYQENDIMTALSYLLGLANEYLLPLVVCLGAGTNQGGHDGTSPLALQLQALIATRGLTVTVGAGNEVGYHHHYHTALAENQEYDDVELRVGAEDPGFCLELWARAPELYTVGFVSPSGEVVAPVPIILGNETVIPFRLDNSRIHLAYKAYEPGSGSQLAFMRFQTPAPGIWHIRVYPTLIAGSFHMWLPMHGFVADDTFFLRPDPDTTIVDPGNATMPLTVSTYNHVNNSIFIHSSRGYTRGLMIKPDLAAPGVDVQGPALRGGAATAGEAGAIAAPAFTRRSGSSVAAAITAGAAADILSWGFTDKNDDTLTSTTVKSILVRGAARSPAFRYPNREWGYGTLDLYQSFLTLTT